MLLMVCQCVVRISCVLHCYMAPAAADDGWDDDDARVVCREQGFDGGYAEWGGSFGPGYEWQPIWMHR